MDNVHHEVGLPVVVITFYGAQNLAHPNVGLLLMQSTLDVAPSFSSRAPRLVVYMAPVGRVLAPGRSLLLSTSRTTPSGAFFCFLILFQLTAARQTVSFPSSSQIECRYKQNRQLIRFGFTMRCLILLANYFLQHYFAVLYSTLHFLHA